MSKQILLDEVVARLTTDVPELSTIGLHRGQFQHGSTISYPCCFIDFGEVDWQDNLEGVQTGEVKLKLLVGFDAAVSSDAVINQVFDKVFVSLQLFEKATFNGLSRSKEAVNSSYSNVVIWEAEYNTTIVDQSGWRGQDLVQATVDPEVVKVDLLKIWGETTYAWGYYDGTVTLTVQGGKAPIDFLWSNGATSQNLMNVPVGSYTVTVTDAVGQEVSESFAVEGFNPVSFGPSLWIDPNNTTRVTLDTTASTDSVRIIADGGMQYAEGAELVVNWNFTDWTSDNPDGWIQIGSETATSYISQEGISQLRFVADATMELAQVILTVGTTYLVEVSVAEVNAGSIQLGDWGDTANRYVIGDTGVHRFYFQPTTDPRIRVTRAVSPCDLLLNYISIKEVQGNHASQPTKANMFGQTTISGRKLLRGSADRFAKVLSDTSLETQNFSIFYVAKTDDKDASWNGGIAKGEVFGTPAYIEYSTGFTAGFKELFISNGSLKEGMTNTVAISDNEVHVYEFVADSTQLKIYVDGVEKGYVNRTYTIDYSNNFDLILGSRENGSLGLVGELGDVIMYPETISTTAREYITNGLKEKYGILWAEQMVQSYQDLNSHATLSQAVLDELLSRLWPGKYLNDTFGPNGQNKKVCDFLYLMEFNANTALGYVTKTGDTFRWDFDGDVQNFNAPPAHTLDQGQVSGICTVSSTDGWEGVTVFNLTNNNFFATCPKFDFPSITTFNLTNNDFAGAIPAFDFPLVQGFQIYGNLWTSIPYLNFPECTTFSIAYGQISGPCPNFYLPKVQAFDISWNQFSGPIPNFSFPAVTRFWVYKNQFSGTCPNFDFPVVDSFVLRANNFSGPCPNFNFPLLTQFWIHENDFSGTCPNWSFPLLDDFRINDNSFSGTMPDFNFPVIYRFFAWNCGFSGTCPSLTGCDTVVELYLNNNSFSGSMPEFNLPSVEVFQLSYNNFSGQCPEMSINNVTTFYINNNNFSDNCPLFEMENVSDFRINDNAFIGDVPEFYFANVKTFNVSNNQFENMSNLDIYGVENFHASSCDFVGNCPSFDSFAGTVRNFYINDNSFSGALPEFAFPNVEVMQVSQNNFTGNLSMNLPALQLFQANNNAFTGYPGSTLADTVTYFNLAENELPEASVDNVLADFTTNLQSRSAATILLNGSENAAPSTAGESDVTTLENNGFTITTN